MFNLVKPVSTKGGDLPLGTCLIKRAEGARPSLGECEKKETCPAGSPAASRTGDGKAKRETRRFWSCCLCRPKSCTWTAVTLRFTNERLRSELPKAPSERQAELGLRPGPLVVELEGQLVGQRGQLPGQSQRARGAWAAAGVTPGIGPPGLPLSVPVPSGYWL